MSVVQIASTAATLMRDPDYHENPNAMAGMLREWAALHESGLDGSGVTIAFVDTGAWEEASAFLRPDGSTRLLGNYDVIDGDKPEDNNQIQYKINNIKHLPFQWRSHPIKSRQS